MSRERIRDYLQQVGPSTSTLVARDLGLPIKYASNALWAMAKAGVLTVEGEGRGLVYTYVREPMPKHEVQALAVEAAASYRDAIRLTPEQRAAAARRRQAAYQARHAERLRKRKRAERARKPKRERQKAAKAGRPRVVTDIAMSAPSSLREAAFDKSTLPDSEAFIRAHPDRYQRLPMDHPWSTAETLTASHRKAILGVA